LSLKIKDLATATYSPTKPAQHYMKSLAFEPGLQA